MFGFHSLGDVFYQQKQCTDDTVKLVKPKIFVGEIHATLGGGSDFCQTSAK